MVASQKIKKNKGFQNSEGIFPLAVFAESSHSVIPAHEPESRKLLTQSCIVQ